VKKCPCETPEAKEAKEKCKAAIEAAKRKREEKTIRELELRQEVNESKVGSQGVGVSRVGDYEEVTCIGSSEPHK
jgi:hypothetical protein